MTQMTTAQLLRAAKAKIADPSNWCQKAYARDRNGNNVHYLHEAACRFCAFGAIRSLINSQDLQLTYIAMLKAAKKLGYESGLRLNDTSDHPTVMKMFDIAIAEAEKAG